MGKVKFDRKAYMKEYMKEYMKNYYANEEGKQRKRQYEKKQREKPEYKKRKHEYYKVYYANNREKFASGKKKRKQSLIEMNDNTINHTSLNYLYDYQNGRCKACGCDLNKVQKNLDHIIPLSKWGIHSIFNVQRLCEYCNKSKHATLPKGQLSLFN